MKTSKLSRVLVALLAALALTAWPAAAATPCPDGGAAAPRVVAVGDVHGSLDGLVEILFASGLIDSGRHWAGGDATLVQIGDVLDRGVDVRGVMDLLIRLQAESRAAGGRVICLMGNHEAMNLLGVQRDTNPAVYERFADSKSEARQKAAWKQQVRVWKARAERVGRIVVDIPEETRTGWLKAHPLGFFEYTEAAAPDGRYGRWLESCPVAVVIGGTLFIHAGLTAGERGLSVAELNRRAVAEVAEFAAARAALVKRKLAEPWASIEVVSLEADQEVEKLSRELTERELARRKTATYIQTLQAVRGWKSWIVGSDDGPLWTRDAADWDDTEHGSEMQALLAGVGARRMVVGHTPQATASIQMRFGGRVFMIDTGMLKSVFGGRPSALEVCGGAVTAIYPGERHELILPGGHAGAGVSTPPPDAPQAPAAGSTPQASKGSPYRWLDVNGTPLPFQDDSAIEHFLAAAEVVEKKEIPVGVTKPIKVTLELGGVRAHAAFKFIDERSSYVEVPILGRPRVFSTFHDYHRFDCAAYRLDRLLGLGRVPPAVPRVIDGRGGTLVMWLEDTIPERVRRERNTEPPDPADFARQRQIVFVFDNITGNTDTNNSGNTLIDRYWHLWSIDCSRCFVAVPGPLTLETVTGCERGLWRRLHEVTDEQIRDALQPFLSSGELVNVLKRREAIVEHISGLIRQRGEDAVLFDLKPPRTEPAQW